MNANSIIVRRSLLPENDSARADFLSNYFCELVVSASVIPEGWLITLRRPPVPDYYIDPHIADGLRWWSETFGPVGVEDIPFAFRDELGFQLSFQDSWTLYSWSKYLSGLKDAAALDKEVTLLHLDDHDDFMTPRLLLSQRKGRWTDAITKREVDLLRPESIRKAIESGAIGIGSFLAPILHSLPRVHVRHLCSTEYTSKRIGHHAIQKEIIEDNLLAPKHLRPAIKLERVHEPALVAGHTYLVTDDLHRWLDGLPDCPALLHIDMDYFNNRFNGDSDWVHHGAKYDPPLTQVLQRIDSVFEVLRESAIGARIVNIAVALSPGFFPADLWSESIGRIRHHYQISA